MSYYSKFLMSVASVLILFGGAVVLGDKSAMTHAASLEPAVTSFQAVGVLRKQNPVDVDALKAEYKAILQSLAQQADAQSGLSLDGEILAAIEDIRNENAVGRASEAIDKTLQRVFFQTILARITSVRDDFSTKTTDELVAVWNEAEEAFQAIIGTAARDNKVLTTNRQTIETGANPGLDIQITEAFARGRVALNKANADEDEITIGVERQNIRLALARAYYIGVLREVESIISNRDRELDKAQEKQKEGEVFYSIIESFININNPVGNIIIKSQLTGNVADVVADEIVSELSKGFIGRVRAELNANESSVGTDRGRAKIVAQEALLYASIFVDDLALRLNSAARTNLLSALADLNNASDADNATQASTARQTASGILDSYENTLLLASYNKTTTTSFVDAAVLSFQAIGTLRRQSPVDADAIAAEYAGELQQLIQFIDATYGLTLDSFVLTAITDIRNGKNIGIAVQIIDKTLQRAFAVGVFDRITLVHNTFNSASTDTLELEWDRAYAAFLAIIGTSARDNKVLTENGLTIETGSKPNIDSQITAAFINGKNALRKENADDATNQEIEREVIILSLVRSFYIGVLREVEAIISNRDREVDEARVKQAEGDFFYRVFDFFIAQDNPSGSATIRAQLSGDVANVNAGAIVQELSKGFVGQLNRNLNTNQSTLGNNQSQAIVAAERALLNARIFFPDLERRLSSLQRVTLESALLNLINATDANDASRASEARQTISEVIAEYVSRL